MPATPNNASHAGPQTQAAAAARLTSLLQEPTHPHRLRTWLSGQTPPPTPPLTPTSEEPEEPEEPAQPTPYYVGYTAALISQEAMDAHQARLIKAAMAAGVQIDWIEQNIWGERKTTTLYKPSAPPSSDSPSSSSS